MEHLSRVTKGKDVLLNGDRLSSESGLLDSQCDGLDLSATQISWDALSLLDLDDVTWDNSLGVNVGPDAVTEYGAISSLHVFEGLKSAVSVSILPDSNDGVENENQKDNEGFHVCG